MIGAAMVVLLFGCSRYDQGTEPMVDRDFNRYASEIQPIVTDTCASLDCHGNAGMPLRLYAERGLRLDRDLRDTPITTEELVANIGAFAGISVGAATVDDDLSLRKPLAESAGGLHHLGGDLWTSTSDIDYQSLRSWLAGP
jgi:hypothetical protein